MEWIKAGENYINLNHIAAIYVQEQEGLGWYIRFQYAGINNAGNWGPFETEEEALEVLKDMDSFFKISQVSSLQNDTDS